MERAEQGNTVTSSSHSLRSVENSNDLLILPVLVVRIRA